MKVQILKMLVRITNREDPDQTASEKKQSDLGLCCLSRHFWQTTRVKNFRTYTLGLIILQFLFTFPTFLHT